MVEIAKMEAGKGKAKEIAEKKKLLAASSSCTSSTRCSAIAASSRHHLSRDHRDADARHHGGGLQGAQGRAEGRARDHDSARRHVEELRDQTAIVNRVAADVIKEQASR
jgi:hypothetical protein